MDSATTFVKSEVFARTFQEGMALVEETANYLDGEGRETSRDLNRETALAYAGISMRLTTQLMQIASWLLVLRAVREGEMSVNEAMEDKYRLKLPEAPNADLLDGGLPIELLGLVENANQLFTRIVRLDTDLFVENAGKARENENDAAGQLRALQKAFGQN